MASVHRLASLLVLVLVASCASDGNAGNSGDGGGDGDGADGGGETSDAGPPDAGVPCPVEGGTYCGGNTVGGDPNVLYTCSGGVLVVKEHCPAACLRMPPGVPDVCPGPPGSLTVPASLIDVLDATPYVEQDCHPTTYPGWPYEAKECTYSSGGLTATVTTATPSAERVGKWIMDSTQLIPALDELRTTDPVRYEEGLGVIGTAVVLQSSRIFPLEGGIIENQGSGYINYYFLDGVTHSCGSGCYCRINSLHRTEWCSYQASLGGSYDGCIAGVGASGYTDAWGNQCLQNHIKAWQSDTNEHFRARAYRYNQFIAQTCPSAGSCSAATVIDQLLQAAQ